LQLAHGQNPGKSAVNLAIERFRFLEAAGPNCAEHPHMPKLGRVL